MFRLRIDIISGLDATELLELCGAQVHVIVRHELPHGNPHYHAYLKYDNTMKENTLRQRIKRKYPELKPSDFSLKKCDVERSNEYVQYMFNTKHGNKWELIDTLNFDNELLHDLMENAKKISDDYDANQTKIKSDKPTIYTLAMEVRKRFTDNYNISNNPVERLGLTRDPPEGALEYREHLKIAIKVCQKYKQPFEENYLRRLVTTAICEGASGRASIISKIMAKEFPDY